MKSKNVFTPKIGEFYIEDPKAGLDEVKRIGEIANYPGCSSDDKPLLHVRIVDPEYDALVEEMIEACSTFKKGFDKGFPNSLNTVEARDAILDAVVKLEAYRAKEKSE